MLVWDVFGMHKIHFLFIYKKKHSKKKIVYLFNFCFLLEYIHYFPVLATLVRKLQVH